MATRFLETGSTDPCYNLAMEQYLLENRREGDWLMLWQNENTVVIGLNQNTLEEIDPDFVQAHGIHVVRRMTGGGAVYHDLGNLNYSFITDLGDGSQLSVGRFTDPVCRALAAMGVRAETSGRNDILVDGKKVSGVAQRVTGGRILHHGTLLFDSDPEMIAGALRADPAKFASKSAKSVRSRVGNLRRYLPEGTDMAGFRAAILRELTADGIERQELSGEELAEVRRIAEERYRSWDWTYGRSPDYEMKNRRRFPGGSLEVRLSSHEGRIRDIAFYGDYMAVMPNEALCEALRGTPMEREALTAALSAFDLPALFGGIGAEEITDTILGQEQTWTFQK